MTGKQIVKETTVREWLQNGDNAADHLAEPDEYHAPITTAQFDFIDECLNYDPCMRPTIEQAIEWLGRLREEAAAVDTPLDAPAKVKMMAEVAETGDEIGLAESIKECAEENMTEEGPPVSQNEIVEAEADIIVNVEAPAKVSVDEVPSLEDETDDVASSS